METIENAKVQLEESRVYLLRIQASECTARDALSEAW